MKEKTLFWLPRVLTILAILFMLMFSFDVFEGNEPLSKKLLGFLMHNIPVIILMVVLVISWIRELIGGILFIIAFIAASIFYRSFTGNPYSLIVIAPFLLTGILFILHHVLYRRNTGEKI